MNKPIGIPTMYNGVLMRSRLEARWAAFFDTLRWPWEYEPFDLQGYIPDFLLTFEAGDVLVEVKPRFEDVAEAQSKIDVSGWDGQAVVVVNAMSTAIGTIRERDGYELPWCDAVLFECLSCGMSSVRSWEGSWGCRICGAREGNAHVGEFRQTEAWNQAGNRVQWRKPE